MAYRYAISDPHGCLGVLKRALDAVDLTGGNELYLLGDYIPHEVAAMEPGEYPARCAESLSFVRKVEAEGAGRVHVLPGNHELMLLEGLLGEVPLDVSIVRWIKRLPAFVETDEQVFVHAGVYEEAGEWWRVGADEWYFCSTEPTFGHFEKDVVAGHVSAAKLAARFGASNHCGVFWDGESHYYIDGTTERSGRIPILRYDVERRLYDQLLATADGVDGPFPIDAPL